MDRLIDALTLHPQEAHNQAVHSLEAAQSKAQALEALLLQAQALIGLMEYRQAVMVLGQSLGLQEQMGQEFSGISLALLAEAQWGWKGPSKASQTAAKALERATDDYSRSRACWVLYCCTHQSEWRQKALMYAQNYPNWLGHLQHLLQSV